MPENGEFTPTSEINRLEMKRKANELLKSPLGQKILREIRYMEEGYRDADVIINPHDSREKHYRRDDFKKRPEKFSIEDLHYALYVTGENLLITMRIPFENRIKFREKIKKEATANGNHIIDGVIVSAKGTDVKFFYLRMSQDVYGSRVLADDVPNFYRRGYVPVEIHHDVEWNKKQLLLPEFREHRDFEERIALTQPYLGRWQELLNDRRRFQVRWPEERFIWKIY